MCYTCGCKRPYDDMGSPNNITERNFEAAGHGDVRAAKENMIELLRLELEKDELQSPKEQY